MRILTVALLALASATSPFAAEPALAPAPSPASAPDSPAGKPTAPKDALVTLAPVEVNSDRLSSIGKTAFGRDDIARQRTATGDINRLLQTVNDVQFAGTGGRITGAGLLDLRPSLVSIAGGRPYDNNFQIDGLNTNSVRDSTNQNIHLSTEAVGHPQGVVLNPALVDSFTIYASDVPAEFGSFTGGVVSAKLRDPAGKLAGGLSVGYTTGAWQDYLTASQNRSTPMPERPRFERSSGDVYVDLPAVAGVSALFAFARNTAVLENTQRNASFGLVQQRSVTVSDNYTLKLLRPLSEIASLRFTSLFSPYAQENREQELKTIRNGSWTNKAEFTHRTERASLEFAAALVAADSSRDTTGTGDLYSFRNFGPGSQVNWVPVNTTLGLRGGLGRLDSTQRDLPLSLKYTRKLAGAAEFSAGATYTAVEARQRQPGEFSAFLNVPIPTVPNPLVISGDGPNDPTVLPGEQALARRLTYPAYDARVRLRIFESYAQLADRGKVFGLPWGYRTGVRYDYDDYLANHVLAPRATATLAPFPFLTVRGGVNRYYSRANVAYSIREKYPSTVTSNRTGRLENGRLVFRAADWVAQPPSNLRNQYAAAGLKTPYSDELSAGLAFDLRAFGTLDLGLLDRRNRDEFSRAATSSEVIGGVTTSYFRLTNAGFTDYRSGTFLWRAAWRAHRFEIGGTFSRTQTSTNDYFDVDSENTRNQLVSYRDQLVTRSDLSLVRANFAKPSYVNFRWSSSWFSDRLTADLFGRWNTAYDQVVLSSAAITLPSGRYDRYLDRRAPENLITNLNLGWLVWRTARASLTLETKITNLTNRLPNADSVTFANPYQEGRAFWAGARYTF